EQQLASLAFTPCSSQDMTKTGWVSPMGDVVKHLFMLQEQQLASLAFTPCSSQDMTKTGWVSPMGDVVKHL
ncbi:recombination-associated protein RdgC, partial [Shigella sp. FC1967]|uniref:recombination-associated protein RdgC n=1 Tax=Shigella sp. FC1967 TaxID=1898041 RepID=UPI000AB84169